MDLAIRKLGNSAGIILPQPVLKSLGLTVGQHVSAETQDGRLVLTPATRKRYTLSELLAQCDRNAVTPPDVADWDNAPAVGKEVI